ncbi:MAG TPA: Co2+/Mg2+ efflux protein ApaG [Methylophilaceae bacterium]|nr:Co2+/Mg2+ efflux protein ApaG [Methylophilaceae bacterium]
MPVAKRYECSVTVETAFVAEQSDIEQNRYVFSYTVTITNIGSMAAQLISRHWVITDAANEIKEVRGLGVVGAQPLLKPGEHFKYTSGSVLKTANGTMHGSYQMVAEDGTPFDAMIEPFKLSMPRVLH